MRLSKVVRQHWAGLRALLVLTAVVGIAYPLFIWLVAQLPGLRDNANGSIIEVDGKPVGSRLIGQSFTDAVGNPLPKYFQSRPSAAGDGYDPLATSASNLGPESIVDTPGDPSLPKDDNGYKPSLLTLVCSRSATVGALDGVDGSRPFCTGGGVGAVLSVLGSARRARQCRAPDEGGQRQRTLLDYSPPVPGYLRGRPRGVRRVRRGLFDRPDRPDPRRRFGGSTGAGRRRHRQRQRPGSPRFVGVRRHSGAPGGEGPRRQRRPDPPGGGGQHRWSGPGVSWASPGSMCCYSTSNWTRSTRPRVEMTGGG